MSRMFVVIVIFVVLSFNEFSIQAEPCNIADNLKNEIRSYQKIVDTIINATTNGKYSGRLFKDTESFVDKFGARYAGTETLEASIDDVGVRMEKAGLKVSTEDVTFPTWIRGTESARMLSPRQQDLSILGLGFSDRTSSDGVTAEVMVVADFEELERRQSEIAGKIVLFNAEFTSYQETGLYRMRGPDRAAQYGAAAALVRSITPFSISTPHTGITSFSSPSNKIPAAAITLENADLIARLIAQGFNVTVNLKMENTIRANVTSRNTFGEIIGKSLPDEVVVLSGHIDSVDVGEGALDDAAGSFLCWHSLALINYLSLPIPRRTIRVILWTGEEVGYSGITDELLNSWTAALLSDTGVYRSLGLSFAGNDEATCIMREITALFGSINATEIKTQEQSFPVPIIESNAVDNDYFWFHHTAGDSMRTLNSEDLDQTLAVFAATAYILADLSIQLPRGGGGNENHEQRGIPRARFH